MLFVHGDDLERIGNIDTTVCLDIQHATIIHVYQIIAVEAVRVFDERRHTPRLVDGIP